MSAAGGGGSSSSSSNGDGRICRDLLPLHLHNVHECQMRATTFSSAAGYESSPVKLEPFTIASTGSHAAAQLRSHINTFAPVEDESMMTSLNANQYGRPAGYHEWNDVTRNSHALFSQQYVPQATPAHSRLGTVPYGWENTSEPRQQATPYGVQGISVSTLVTMALRRSKVCNCRYSTFKRLSYISLCCHRNDHNGACAR